VRTSRVQNTVIFLSVNFSSSYSTLILDLTNNIANIFRKFVDEGRSTISFKLPEIDLQIKADPIQMKAFLNVMKSQLCPQDSKTKDVLKTDNKMIRAFGSSSKMMVENVTKMVIKERSGFPAKGLPRTLKELTVTEIGCSQMPIGILNLTNLSTLDLSRNSITKLPKALGNLRLTKLILSENKLGDSTNFRDWDWLNSDNIKRSLGFLSISKNNLKFIPSAVLKCTGITHLDMSHNAIVRIPFAIKLMKQLRLFYVNNNELTSLPYTIIKPNFDMIELSANRFPSQTTAYEIIRGSHQEISNQHQYRAPSLLELTARTVIKRQIPFMSHNIPHIIKEILFHSPLCANSKCEAMCFDVNIFSNINLIQLSAKTITTSDNAKHFIADGPFCSRACEKATHRKLFRQL
jgi:LRR-repeat protein 1